MTVKRHLIGLLAGCCVLAACAKPPLDEQQAAHYLVGQAYRLQAEQLAPEAYQAAHQALDQADAAMRSQDYDEARRIYVGARYHATAAAYRARQEANRLDAMLRDQPPGGKAGLPAQLKQLNLLLRPTPPPAPIAPATESVPAQEIARPAPQLAVQVTVKPGESLFTIAGTGVVYNDPLLWPLLYQANRDQIKDPRQIFPGQELTIPRDVSVADMERARTIARQSTIFPVE